MERTQGNTGFLCTMRELQRDTYDVIKLMNEEDLPVIVTKHGRFVAIMRPLANIPNLDQILISRAVEELGLGEPVDIDDVYSVEEAMKQIDLPVSEQSSS